VQRTALVRPPDRGKRTRATALRTPLPKIETPVVAGTLADTIYATQKVEVNLRTPNAPWSSSDYAPRRATRQ
jgi:hypothetical protein